MAVYPRWRGEHLPDKCVLNRHCGLSPLARGTPEIPAWVDMVLRFIPAGAGNTGG